MVLISGVLITSCKNGSDSSKKSSNIPTVSSSTTSSSSSKHENVYEGEWLKNEEGHYKECECGEGTFETLPHNDQNKDGKCDECHYVIEEEKSYIVKVLFEDEPISNVEIKFSNNDEEVIVSTDEFGVAQSSFIYVDEVKAIVLSVPENYMIPEEKVLVANEENIIYIAKQMATYTVNTQESDGTPLKNVVVNLLKDEKVMHTQTSDENGIVTFNIPKDDYKLEVKHINSALVFEGTEEVFLTPEDNTYTASFTRNESFTEYIFEFVDNEGNLLQDLIIYVFNIYGDCDGALAVNGIGQAVTFYENQDFFIRVFDSKLNNEIYYLEKDGYSYNRYVFDSQEKAGSSIDNPVMIFDIVDKPFVPAPNLYYNWDYQFEAGEVLYVKVPNALGKNFSIDGNKFEVSYNEKVLIPGNDGRISTYFEDVEFGEDIILKIKAKEATVDDISYYDMSYPNNKKWLNTQRSEVSSYTMQFYYVGQKCYYEFPARFSGTLTITSDSATFETSVYETQGGSIYDLAITSKVVGEVTFTFTYTNIA